MKQTIFLLATLLIFTISSCQKDDENTKANFSVKQKTSNLKSTGTFTFSKALIGINEINFEIEKVINDQDFEYEGVYQFNILTGTCSPAISSVEITPGTYHDLEINIDKVLSSGNSIEISGTYDNGTSYQFEYSSTFNEDYDIENTAGINAKSGENINFVLYLDLETLFNGVDFSTANVNNDSIIRINSSSNSDLASIIEDNFDDIMDYEYEND